MIVVAVVALLSALSVYGVRKYILASKTSEAVEMLGAVRAAQEAYKADTFAYRATVGDPATGKSLASGPTYTNFYPQQTALKRAKIQWGGGDAAVLARWNELGVSSASPVQYIYGCAAGTGADTPATPAPLVITGYPTGAPGTVWYLCKAVGDLDGNEVNGEWGYSSFADEVAHTKNEE